MIPFYTKFPDLAFKEIRSATTSGSSVLPDDNYAFIEYYCEKLDCDCRRVILIVISKSNGNKALATINYGWESLDFYAKWMGDREDAEDMVGASLERLGEQTRLAPYLLELFNLLLEDKSYVERLKKHYEMFKRAIKNEYNQKKRMRAKPKKK